MPSASERRDRVRALFHAALEHDAAGRTAFLQAQCGDDQPLFHEVHELIRDYLSLESPTSTDRDPMLGKACGPYLISRLLGEGGMGRVYLARRVDGIFEKSVAIKVIDPSSAAQDLVARFEQERRLLASLSHPGIADVLDAGRTDEGQQYLVMEFVDGPPITTYCTRRDLPMHARLRLFRRVCDAVAEAHRKLVVHRDIKPGNILVDPSGQPKLLDFGIAKPLTPSGLEASDPTASHLRRATPAYASPEQLQGGPAHTGMDIFALGVVLHELLTGHRPWQTSATFPTGTGAVGFLKPSAGLARHREGQATKPASTTLDAVSGPPDVTPADLEGDLDAILLKALQSDPGLRYRSVDALGADLDAYLSGHPVVARAGGRSYVARKFVGRNRAAAALGGIALLAIVVSIASVTWLWLRAAQERDAATAELEAARSLTREIFALDSALAGLPGSTEARRRLIAAVGAHVTSLAQGRSLALDLEAAEGRRRLADVLGNPNVPNLGEPARALEHYRAALAILDRLPPASSATREVVATRVRTQSGVGDVLLSQRALAEAEREYLAALTLAEALVTREPDNPETGALVSGVYRPLGDLRLAQGDIPGATSVFEKALAIDQANERRHPGAAEYLRLLALTRFRLAEARLAGGALAEARRGYEQVAELLARLAPAQLANISRDLALSRARLGAAMWAGGDRAGLAETNAALQMLRALAMADPANARAQSDVASALVQWADLVRIDDPAAATQAYREARVTWAALASSSANSGARRRLASLDRRIAEVASGFRGAELRLFVVEGVERRLVQAGTPAAAAHAAVSVQATVGDGWSRYLLVFGAEGPAQLFDEAELARRHWTFSAAGPPPSQTVLLIATPSPLTAAARQRLIDDVSAVPGPRMVDWETHIVWSLGEEAVEGTVSARGSEVPWVADVRKRLEALGRVAIAGRTFPLAPGLR